MTDSIREAKALIRTKRDEGRARHRLRRRCFWSRPWGHFYRPLADDDWPVCVGCGKRMPMTAGD